MNKEWFLNTGLLEQYALGLTNEEENQEVEKYLNAFPELNKEVDAIQKAVEQYALQHAVPPPKNTKSNILSEIDSIENKARIKTAPNRRSSGRWWLAAAAILGFATTIALFFLYAQKQAQYQNLASEFESFRTDCEIEKQRFESDEKLFAFLKDPNTKKIYLGGLDPKSTHQAIAYWNPSTQKAIVNLSNLPTLPDDQQYQIWGDIDHVMVNAGILVDDQSQLQEIKFLEKAETLNITIEPKGGSEAPTVANLIVAGKV